MIYPCNPEDENFDFTSWKTKVDRQLYGFRALELVQGHILKPTLAKDIGSWDSINRKAYTYLAQCLTPSSEPFLEDVPIGDSRAAYSAILGGILRKTSAAKKRLLKKVLNLTQLSGESVVSYFSRMKRLRNQLKDLYSINIQDDIVQAVLEEGMDAKFSALKIILDTSDTIDLVKLQTILMDQEDHFREHNQPSDHALAQLSPNIPTDSVSTSSASSSTSQTAQITAVVTKILNKKSKSSTCIYCHKPGHRVEDCWKLQSKIQQNHQQSSESESSNSETESDNDQSSDPASPEPTSHKRRHKHRSDKQPKKHRAASTSVVDDATSHFGNRQGPEYSSDNSGDGPFGSSIFPLQLSQRIFGLKQSHKPWNSLLQNIFQKLSSTATDSCTTSCVKTHQIFDVISDDITCANICASTTCFNVFLSAFYAEFKTIYVSIHDILGTVVMHNRYDGMPQFCLPDFSLAPISIFNATSLIPYRIPSVHSTRLSIHDYPVGGDVNAHSFPYRYVIPADASSRNLTISRPAQVSVLQQLPNNAELGFHLEFSLHRDYPTTINPTY